MTKLSKSQKKGKFSIHNSRFLKKKSIVNSYKDIDFTQKYQVRDFRKCTKSSSIMAVLRPSNGSKDLLYLCPEQVRSGSTLNDETDNRSLKIKTLKQYTFGQKVCAIERHINQKKYFCSAAGTYATIYAQKTDLKKTVLLIKKRQVLLPWDNKAASGLMSNSNFNLKPMCKAGTASRIAYAKGKKYPLVSEHKKNALDSCIGGSYKKNKRIQCVRHDTNPKNKTGHIAPSRTGVRKRS